MSPNGVRRAGFGDGPDAGDRLFDAILASPSGVVFTDDEWDETWRRITTSDGLVHLEIPELLGELAAMARRRPARRRPAVAVPAVGGGAALVHGEHDPARPGVAQARRRRRAAHLAGRCRRARARRRRPGPPDDEAGPGASSPSPSTRGCTPGTWRSPTGSASTTSTTTAASRTGVAPNELTASEDRDPWVGTPWHKSVPARLEPSPDGRARRLHLGAESRYRDCAPRSPHGPSAPRCVGARPVCQRVSPWPPHGAATASSGAATGTSAGACTARPAWSS